jgi:hypothetical protein
MLLPQTTIGGHLPKKSSNGVDHNREMETKMTKHIRLYTH